MLVLSPRTYVTEAFDLLFPALLEYVYNKLCRKENWWEHCILKNNSKTYFIDSDIREKIYKASKPTRYEELFEYFDEYSLLKLITIANNSVSNLFRNEYYSFDELLNTRNEWAHCRYENYYTECDDLMAQDWADASLDFMAKVAQKTLKYENVANLISTLKSKMKYDFVNNKNELRSRDELIEFLNDNVMYQVDEPNCPLDEHTKIRIINFRLRLRNDTKTSEHVINEFWDAIKIKGDVYDAMKKHGLITFEDVCADFAAYCIVKKD